MLSILTKLIKLCTLVMDLSNISALCFSPSLVSIYGLKHLEGHSDICGKCRSDQPAQSAKANLERHFPFMYFFCFEQVDFSTKSNVVVKCRLGSADLKQQFTHMSECPFWRIVSHMIQLSISNLRRLFTKVL